MYANHRNVMRPKYARLGILFPCFFRNFLTVTVFCDVLPPALSSGTGRVCGRSVDLLATYTRPHPRSNVDNDLSMSRRKSILSLGSFRLRHSMDPA